MSKWLPSILAVASAVVTALTPAIQGAISHHPLVSVILGTIYGIFSHVLPSPLSGK